MIYHIIVPVFGTAFYIWVSCWLKYYSENNKLSIVPKKIIHSYSLIHNAGLSSFSFYTFVQLCTVLINKGIHAGRGYYMSINSNCKSIQRCLDKHTYNLFVLF
jgi:diphthamide biosynthesis methyltransferase